MKKMLTLLAAASVLSSTTMVQNPATAAEAKPTIVLVHGAFADSSSWDGVIAKLQKDGYSVIGAANPLRSVKTDADYVAGIVKNISGPVLLVGHSYGGSVISAAVQGNSNVRGLLYVAAFAPESGESAIELSGKFPGSSLGLTLAPPVALPGVGEDLYIQIAKFHDQFAADVPKLKARQMAAGQRPVTAAALNEASPAPAWKTLPSWFIYGKADKNIPAAAQDFMAKRAASKKTVVIEGASHVVMTSHPTEVATLIEEAASNL